jgi:hypothetical protein
MPAAVADGGKFQMPMFRRQTNPKPESRNSNFGSTGLLVIGRSAFGVWPLPFGIWHLAFGIWHLAFGISSP